MTEQLGVILEFLGYCFGVPAVIGMQRLIQLEDRIESLLKLLPWLSVVCVNLLAVQSTYQLYRSLADQDVLRYGFGLVFVGPAVMAVALSVVVGVRMTVVLQDLMFARMLFSIRDIGRLFDEMWNNSLKAFTLRWLSRCMAISFCIVLPVALVWVSIDVINSADVSTDDRLAVLSLFAMLVYYYVAMCTLAFLGLVVSGYWILTGFALLLKRLLIDLADNTAFHRRALWWTVTLSIIGLFLQLSAAESTTEQFGITAEILAFVLLLPELVELIPRSWSHRAVQIGAAVFCGSLILQLVSPITWLSRIGLLAKAIAFFAALPAIYGPNAFDDVKVRPLLWRAFWLYSCGISVQLAAAFLA